MTFSTGSREPHTFALMGFALVPPGQSETSLAFMPVDDPQGIGHWTISYRRQSYSITKRVAEILL